MVNRRKKSVPKIVDNFLLYTINNYNCLPKSEIHSKNRFQSPSKVFERRFSFSFFIDLFVFITKISNCTTSKKLNSNIFTGLK